MFKGRYTASGEKKLYFKRIRLELMFSDLQLNDRRTIIHVEIIPSSTVMQKRKTSTEIEWQYKEYTGMTYFRKGLMRK